MKTLTYVLCAGLTLSSLALAQDNTRYQCSYGELVRRVEIYTEPGVTVPCEVHYFKDTEAPGESEVLWSAQSQAGYCEQKTEEFIVKLQEWGWTCGASEAMSEPEAAPDPEAAPAEVAEPEVADDTDVLSPGDPAGS